MSTPNKSGDTVTVACKLPFGLILRVYQMIDAREPRLDGGVNTIKRAQQIGDDVVVKGYSSVWQPGDPSVEAHYVLTHGIPAAVWERWLSANSDADIVKNRLIFASAASDRAHDESREHERTRCGLEPIEPPPSVEVVKQTPKIPVDPRIKSLAMPVGTAARRGA